MYFKIRLAKEGQVRAYLKTLVVTGLILVLGACSGHEQDTADKASPATPKSSRAVLVKGNQVYEENCAMCHDGADPAAPKLSSIGMMDKDAIHGALTTGKMAQQGALLTVEERNDLITWLTRDQKDIGDWEKPLPVKQR